MAQIPYPPHGKLTFPPPPLPQVRTFMLNFMLPGPQKVAKCLGGLRVKF